MARFIAPKGSVTLDGTSLTVNEVEGNFIRRQHHSAYPSRHHMGPCALGDAVNIEIDMLARYVARLAEFGKS